MHMSSPSPSLHMTSMPLAKAMQSVLSHGSAHKKLPRIPLEKVVLGTLNVLGGKVDEDVFLKDDETGDGARPIAHGVALLPDLGICAKPVCAIAGILSSAPIDFQVSHRVEPKPVPYYMKAVVQAKPSVVMKPLDPATDGTQAGYGDLATGTAKFDPHVRKARVLSPGDVCVTLSEADLAHVTHQVEQRLFPHCASDSKHVELRFNKVNIYGPGDFFGKHVDTPRQGVWGTVVVVAPREMFGADSDGGLVVYNGDNDGSATLREPVARDAPVFMAFYSDVVHEVQPVTTGFRVSITYDVMVKNTVGAGIGTCTGAEVSELPCLSPHCSRVEALRLLHHVHERGGNDIIVLCSHKYSFDEVEAGVLKGVDATLATTLRTFTDCKDMQLVPLALKTHVVLDIGEDPELPKTDIELYRMTRADLVRAMTDATGLGDDGVLLTVGKKHVLFVPTSALLHVVGDHIDTGVEYTGNESRPTIIDCRYWVCGMVFHRQTYGISPSPPWNWASSSSFPTVGGVDV